MLQLNDIRKSYTTGDFTQVALDGVSISFRDNEFAAILGPSGSGKTTLLNIIGGLDHYDSGDLLIDGVSTKGYKDRDWDTYRNNRIGFVFQSYNLIPHQTVLANVELALTLSGVGREERRERAVAELKRVGLGDHINKKPSQLSGGQMQRVAIARALINDPEILLADEPTGALDSKTSVQIMDLLTEIAKDRLVIMVTHNPELADEYATRIVNLADGHILADTDPYAPTPDELARTSNKKVRRASMSFLTALSLSFNNLMTKKGRTIMTAFAGSIGIIGIAAILSLANGVNNYIANVEEETLSVYPLQIDSTGFDMTTLMANSMGMGGESDDDGDAATQTEATDAQDGTDLRETKMVTSMFASVENNDLASLKAYLDDNATEIDRYAKSVQYEYNVVPQVFDANTSDGVRQINPDTTFTAMGLGGTASGNAALMTMSTDIFACIPDDPALYEEQYELVAGHLPEEYNEVLFVVGSHGTVPDVVLYGLGLRDHDEIETMVRQFVDGDEVVVPEDVMDISYEDIMDVRMKVVCSALMYQHDDQHDVWVDKSEDEAFMKTLVDGAPDLRISGILKVKEDAKALALGTGGIGYTTKLTQHLIEEAGATQIVQEQLAEPSIDVFNGRSFAEQEDEGPEFDMGSLFTVDTGALQSAFTFDTSKLQLDLSSLNINFNSSSLPQPEIDFSKMDAQVPDAGGQPGASGDAGMQVNQQVASQMVGKLMEGFMQAHPVPTEWTRANVEAYLMSDAAKQVLDQAMKDGLIDMSAMQQQQVAQQAAMQKYLNDYMTEYMTNVVSALSAEVRSAVTQAVTKAMGSMAANMSSAMSVDADAFKDAFRFDMTEDELTELIMSMMNFEQASYDGNLAELDYADLAKPYSIDIYAKDFEAKQGIIDMLDAYNERMVDEGQDDKEITYTDLVGTLMSSVTTIIDMISYVLIAFVSISLIVSSIMIGIITYISVLERKKEIGILRAIGASKGNISQIFNAETIIEGLTSGILGVGITALCCIPASAIVYALFDVPNVASLPWVAGLVLILISVALSFIAGLIPARSASRRDPVEALRSE